MKRETFPTLDPMKPYGSNPVTMESINVREQHALDDQLRRYTKAFYALKDEHERAVELIKAAFEQDRQNLIMSRRAA